MQTFNKNARAIEEISLDIIKLESQIAWYPDYKNQQLPRLINDLKVILDISKNKQKKDFSILDVGSNPPFLLSTLTKLGFNALGVDSSPQVFAKTIDKYDLEVSQCNIELESLPFPDNTFDCVVFTEVFEHLRIDPIFTVSELYRVLKKDGVLILETPNLYSIKGIYNFIVKGKTYSCATNSVYDEFKLVQTMGFFGHIREYTYQEVERFLNQIGFAKSQVLFRGGGKRFITKPIYSLFNNLRPSMMFLAYK